MSQELIYHSAGDLNKIYKKYHNNISKLMTVYNSLDKQLVLPMEPIISDINDSVYFKTKMKDLSSEIKLKLSFKYYILEALTIALLENLRYKFPVKYIDADNIIPVITFNLLIKQIIQSSLTKKLVDDEEYVNKCPKLDYYFYFLKELRCVIGEEAEDYDNGNFKEAYGEITSYIVLILEKYLLGDYHLDSYQSIKHAIDGLMTICKNLSNKAFYRAIGKQGFGQDVLEFNAIANGTNLKTLFTIRQKFINYFSNRECNVYIFTAPENFKDRENDYFKYRKYLIGDKTTPRIGNFVTVNDLYNKNHLFYKNSKVSAFIQETALYFDFDRIPLENLIKFKENAKDSLTDEVFVEIGIEVPSYVTKCIVKNEDIWPKELKIRDRLIYLILKLPITVTDLLEL